MNPRRGPIVAGEKIQFTDRKGKKITDQLTAGICRELTKLHEEVLHTTLGEAADLYGEHGQEARGEFVLVVAGGSPREKDIPSLEDGAVRVEKLQEAGMSLRDASKLVAKELELSKNQLYQFMLEKVKKV